MFQLDFTKKTVIVTGGGSGIGYAIAEAFFACGANVVLCGRREEVLKSAVLKIEDSNNNSDRGEVIYVVADMSREDDVEMLVQRTVEQFSQLDVFINNAGEWMSSPILEIKESDILTLVKNNLVATILGTKYAALSMAEGGVIINIGSFAGILPQRNSSVYASVKSAVHQFTKSSAAELAEKGIRVNCVIPGVIRTAMTSDYIDSNIDNILRAIPLGRVGTTGEVAHSVLFLSSDIAKYTTGASLQVSGGKYVIQL